MLVELWDELGKAIDRRSPDFELDHLWDIVSPGTMAEFDRFIAKAIEHPEIMLQPNERLSLRALGKLIANRWDADASR
ncbi:MAG TPA: hypothetical protein VK509_08305 [Polyangiales bacterium]|nr:hypothetical protein [Polyangiales bacterium]